MFGCAFALIGIFMGVFIVEKPLAWGACAAFLSIYITLLLFNKQLIVQNGEAFAKKLFAEFLVAETSKKDADH